MKTLFPVSFLSVFPYFCGQSFETEPQKQLKTKKRRLFRQLVPLIVVVVRTNASGGDSFVDNLLCKIMRQRVVM